MNDDNKAEKEKHILSYAWDAYRDWAASSRQQKKKLFRWRAIVLLLGMVGAAFETIVASEIFSPIKFNDIDIIGILGFICLALAAYFSRNILGGKPEKKWIGARSVSEALKSESYKYVTRVSTYKGDDKDQQLIKKVNVINDSANSLGMIPESSNRAKKSHPKTDMSVEEYINDRLIDQINRETGFYWKSARLNKKKVKGFSNSALFMGVVTAVLGGCDTFNISGTAIWVAVLTTFSTSLAAYFQAGRYEYLVTSYSATARRLENLLAQWNANPDVSEKESFILACEEAISFENHGWIAEWLGEEEKPSP